MKRFTALALSVCMSFALSACGTGEIRPLSDSESSTGSVTESQPETESGKEETKPGTPEEGDEGADPDNNSSGSNILVAYFSCTGTTGQIAEWIADETGAAVFRGCNGG